MVKGLPEHQDVWEEFSSTSWELEAAEAAQDDAPLIAELQEKQQALYAKLIPAAEGAPLEINVAFLLCHILSPCLRESTLRKSWGRGFDRLFLLCCCCNLVMQKINMHCSQATAQLTGLSAMAGLPRYTKIASALEKCVRQLEAEELGSRRCSDELQCVSRQEEAECKDGRPLRRRPHPLQVSNLSWLTSCDL